MVAPEDKPCTHDPIWNTSAGLTSAFTLVEVLIAVTIGMVLIGSVYSVYTTQVRSHRHHQLIMEAQQNLRGAMMIMEHEIRLAGYDPLESGLFGIVDVRRYYEVDSNVVDPDGQPALFYTVDMDENGALDDRNANRNREHPNFRIRNDRKIHRRYLAWDLGGGRQPLAENIRSMGLAYAVDADGDGIPDRWKGGQHLIWAVDADNDNRLDVHLDNNDDGRIDIKDDRNGDGIIDGADGGRLDPPIGVDRIKAVRVWLLAISSYPLHGRGRDDSLMVGDRLAPADKDGFRHQLLEAVIYCRNL